jgi:plastocyanin
MRRATSRMLSIVMLALGSSAIIGGVSMQAAQAGGSCHAVSSSAKGVQVELSSLCFQPTVLYAKPGQSVTWTNNDAGTAHNVTGLGFSWGSNGDLYTGDAFTHAFAREGVYPYSCFLHPGMVGAVVVESPTASSSTAAVAPVVPAAPQTSAPALAAPPAQPAPAVVRTSSTGVWRTVALVTGALSVAAIVLFALQLAHRRRARTAAAG